MFLVGDIFLTLIRSERTLSIGVFRSTTASLSGVTRGSINVGVMKAVRTTCKITGQLLSLIPTHPSPDVSQLFLWDGGYVKARSVIQGTSESTEHVIIVTVPGSLVEPINAEATFIRLRDNINSDEFTQVNGGQSTWQVSRDVMQAACDMLWAKAVELKIAVKSIATVTSSDPRTFPYHLPDGKLCIFIYTHSC